MLAKIKLEQLKKEKEIESLDQKIIDAISLDLIIKTNVSLENVPKDLIEIFGIYDEKVYKTDEGNKKVYYSSKNRYEAGKLIKDFYQIKLVEDFDTYYQEIKTFSKENIEKEKQSFTTYNFLLGIASVILFIGIIGGLITFSVSFEIGVAVIISTASFSAILFGLAKIISLLSKQIT